YVETSLGTAGAQRIGLIGLKTFKKRQRLGAISTATGSGGFAVEGRYGDRQQPCDRWAAGKVVQSDQMQLQIERQTDCQVSQVLVRLALHFVHSSTSQLELGVRAPKQAIEPGTSDRSNRSVLVTF